jgi:hypothetical protein
MTTLRKPGSFLWGTYEHLFDVGMVKRATLENGGDYNEESSSR